METTSGLLQNRVARLFSIGLWGQVLDLASHQRAGADHLRAGVGIRDLGSVV